MGYNAPLMSDSIHSGAPDRLDRAIAAAAGISRTAARTQIAAGAVFLNGQRCKVASRIVRPGDRLRCGESVTVAVAALHIVFEADGVIAIDKPAGMPSVPSKQAAAGTALTELEAQLAGRPGAAPRLWVVHRLDASTSGVLAFATSRASAASLSDAFRLQRVDKRYVALVEPGPPIEAGRIELSLSASSGRAHVAAAGKAALTEWRLRERRGAGALLDVEPRSGRMHQIRVHLAAIGCPIVGDRLYGGVASARLMLHAAALTLPLCSGRVTIEAAQPF